VRTSFNRAKEGGIRVPPYFHVYHQKYQKAVRKHYQETGMSLSMEAAADSLDLSVERLGFILQRTQTPMSIYAGPKYSSNIRAPAGKAGGDPLRSEQNMELIHSLPDNEPPVLDQIEVSLLRRCLENAMATELSPHERDVLRLRHGLDDGVFRSSREVAEFCGGTISVSDVRSAELRACRKLRSPYSVHTVQLYDFLDFVGADLNTVKTTKSKR
jgi:DNA-directed RNA polymerase sigma subunit (sigma70/sigma32)